MASQGSPAPHTEPPGEKKERKNPHHQQTNRNYHYLFSKTPESLLKANDYEMLADKETGWVHLVVSAPKHCHNVSCTIYEKSENDLSLKASKQEAFTL